MQISIIIRAKDEERLIGECLRRVFQQEKVTDVEVIVIDSGSEDKTTQIVHQFPAHLIEIKPGEFNYGGTLNLGVREARSDLIVSLTAHALPIGKHWLSTLTLPLEQGSRVAATFSREMASPEADIIEKRRLRKTFAGRPTVYDQNSATIPFSNVASALRRDLLLQEPFRELPYSEDQEWAGRIAKLGYQIVYTPEAKVWHFHNDSLGQLYHRYFAGGKADYLLSRKRERFGSQVMWHVTQEAIKDSFFERTGWRLGLMPFVFLCQWVRRVVIAIAFNRGRAVASK